MVKLAPSILSADMDNLVSDVLLTEKGGADYVHCDIMDGKFVEKITFGPEVVETMIGKTKMPFDVHLMVVDPEVQIPKYDFEQTKYICFHRETVDDVKSVIGQIHALGKKAGIAINPETSTDTIKAYLDMVEMVLIMSVHPGKGGQKFMPETVLKICELDEIRKNKHLSFVIEVDGGINTSN